MEFNRKNRQKPEDKKDMAKNKPCRLHQELKPLNSRKGSYQAKGEEVRQGRTTNLQEQTQEIRPTPQKVIRELTKNF